MSDDPFAEPDDSDNTVIAPRWEVAAHPPRAPGRAVGAAPLPPLAFGRRSRRRTAGGRAGRAPKRSVRPQSADVRRPRRCCNCSAACATPFQRTERATICANAPCARSASSSRPRATAASRLDLLRPAHYALCASLDDVVLNTPVGQPGRVGRALAGLDLPPGGAQRRTFLRVSEAADAERRRPPAGARTDVLLPVARLSGPVPAVAARPGRNRPPARGSLRADHPRSAPAATGRCRRTGKGVNAPYRPRRAELPLWVWPPARLAIVGGLFVWFSSSLNAASDDRSSTDAGRAADSDAGDHPQRAGGAARRRRTPRAGPAARLPGAGNRRGLVSVVGDHAMPVVRIRNTACSPPAAPRMSRAYYRLLERIGSALRRKRSRCRSSATPTTSRSAPCSSRPTSSSRRRAPRPRATHRADARRSRPGHRRWPGRRRSDRGQHNGRRPRQNRRIEVVLHRQG